MQTIPIAALRNFAEQLDRRAEALTSSTLPDGNETNREKLAEAYLRLGMRIAETGYPENAIDCYRKAMGLAPSDPDLHYEILFKLERLNRIDEAWEALLALERAPASPYDANKKLHILKARLEYRRGNLETSRTMLENFLAENSAHTHRHLAFGWLGTVLDELGHYDAAMSAFDGKNAALLQAPIAAKLLDGNDAELEAINTSLGWYSNRPSFGWQETSSVHDIPTPIVLVGFPRSGTTLLDQILDSHPALSVIEEKPTLDGIATRFFGNEDKLAALKRLSEAEADIFRKRYWSNISRILGSAPDDLRVVDKLPLNIMHLDVYARLFPNAKIIVAIRDPRDVILSNYMQLYQLNPSMAANLSLARCAGYYAKVMTLYLRFRELMPGNIHEVRYEQIVHDFVTEGTNIMGFLGIEWRSELTRFHEHARRRSIVTPSYHQAVKPIYRNAEGRWNNYRTHIESVLPLLQPYLVAFGY